MHIQTFTTTWWSNNSLIKNYDHKSISFFHGCRIPYIICYFNVYYHWLVAFNREKKSCLYIYCKSSSNWVDFLHFSVSLVITKRMPDILWPFFQVIMAEYNWNLECRTNKGYICSKLFSIRILYWYNLWFVGIRLLYYHFVIKGQMVQNYMLSVVNKSSYIK